MKKYGCYNTERKPGYWANDGYSGASGLMKRVFVPDIMTKACQYDKRNTDVRCAGCEKDAVQQPER